MTDSLTIEADEKVINKSNGYTSSPIKSDNSLQIRLERLFDEELNSENSVLLSYNKRITAILAEFITGKIKRSASIGIAGETASGKSTITLDIIDAINEYAEKRGYDKAVTRVNSDDYYYDRSNEVKKAGGMSEFAKTYDFDTPHALELPLMSRHIKQLLSGRQVFLPKYDMSGTAIRIDNSTLAKPSKIIISEGLFTLTDEIKEAFDFKIYVDINPQVRRERFFIRANERGLGDSANTLFQNASNKAEIYIRPAKNIADIVLSGESNRENYKIFVRKILNIIDEYKLSKRA